VRITRQQTALLSGGSLGEQESKMAAPQEAGLRVSRFAKSGGRLCEKSAHLQQGQGVVLRQESVLLP